MKKIEIRGKKYDCPTSWMDITLSQQLAVSRDSDKIENDSLKKLAILSGYCNIPLSELKHCQLSELPALFENIAFINQPIPDKPMNEFDFKGNHYYVGQNLADSEFQDYISLENALEMYSGQTYAALPTILAIMCKQKKDNGLLETLDDYSIAERTAEFYSLPISIANGLALFFYNSVNLYKQTSLLYSNPEALMKEAINSLDSMHKPLAGKGLLTRCVNGIYRIWIKSIKRKLVRLYISTQ
jgi:hypothetical protein